MDFVPLASFEFLNSLLQGVEAQGCLMTVRLEAFTCRSTRKKKQLAASMAHYANANTPPLAPASHAGLSPPPLQLDGRLPVVFAPVDPEEIDDRLVYLVAALNSIYGEDGYDFSVLTEEDFVVCNEAQVRAEVDVTLHSMSDSCRPAVEQFWTLVSEQVMDASQGCEYFRFMCPTCDPMVSRSLFSQHYFLYNRRSRLLVSLLIFAEGNAYRGDDGVIVGNGFYVERDDADTDEGNNSSRGAWQSSPEPLSSDDGVGGKNLHYYYGH
ncbi:hypothetical protein TcG_04476 [Trypanosoma cruzi]|uniref:Repressor of RNA polymerase III transcription n=2 Tax=Trypanosoma cruzi TaxID=5693 RepID=V5AS30_TRYCR|nr:hypothetical protein TCDM_08562 [Trypanosoma cruzi Dm28c]KAF8290719.1 putative Maf1 regulator [Trypanosoma cruzi]PWU84684.1 hypothetical protein C4B63_208g33 [Trypanosoma cruzi]PWU87433.1 hypothetical protein C4B63_92g62 [Trypanosoma cruzi]RNF18862.1 hypothetical protein TcG_04476 [Trypanosoma cruzi]